jgi:hypothetical protein
METVSSSEMLVDFQRNTWRYIPEDRNYLFLIHTSVINSYFMVVNMCSFDSSV